MDRLGHRDKAVLHAFAMREPAESKKLATDGQRLDGMWMGGSNIAEWAAGHVVFHDLGSRSAQTVQRALKKMIPARQFGGFNRGPGEYWIAKALAKHKKGALHRDLHVAAGKKIPGGKLRHAASMELHGSGSARAKQRRTKRRAVLARTLSGFRHSGRRT